MIVKICDTFYVDFNTVASVYFYDKEENTELHSFSVKYNNSNEAMTYRVTKDVLDAFVARMNDFCDMSEAHLEIYRTDLKSSKIAAEGKFIQLTNEFENFKASQVKPADTNPEPTVN